MKSVNGSISEKESVLMKNEFPGKRILPKVNAHKRREFPDPNQKLWQLGESCICGIAGETSCRPWSDSASSLGERTSKLSSSQRCDDQKLTLLTFVNSLNFSLCFQNLVGWWVLLAQLVFVYFPFG